MTFQKAIIDTGLNTWLATKVTDSKVTDPEAKLPCNIQLPVSDHVQWLKIGGPTGGPCGGSPDSSTTVTDYDFLAENVQKTDDWLMVTETGYKPMVRDGELSVIHSLRCDARSNIS